jgi:hypothetical protein
VSSGHRATFSIYRLRPGVTYEHQILQWICLVGTFQCHASYGSVQAYIHIQCAGSPCSVTYGAEPLFSVNSYACPISMHLQSPATAMQATAGMTPSAARQHIIEQAPAVQQAEGTMDISPGAVRQMQCEGRKQKYIGDSKHKLPVIAVLAEAVSKLDQEHAVTLPGNISGAHCVCSRGVRSCPTNQAPQLMLQWWLPWTQQSKHTLPWLRSRAPSLAACGTWTHARER